MKSRFFLVCVFALSSLGLVHGGAFDEVNAWRRAAGLPQLIEDPAMSEFARRKAQFRAARGLKNGHQGPSVPAGWIEGCGEATASWGWLTCATECDFQYGGAGVAIGGDGERYMVFVGRGGSGRALINPNRYPIVKTAHLTPNPMSQVAARSVSVQTVPQAAVPSRSVPPQSVVSKSSAPVRCSKCGQVH